MNMRAEFIKSHAKGFLVPEFTERLPNGTILNGLTAEGIRMIKAGYACGECLMMFDVYVAVCPSCGLARDVAADMKEPPQLWLDHLAARNQDDAPATPKIVPHKAIEAAMSSGQMEETIPITKLRESKKKRVRKT